MNSIKKLILLILFVLAFNLGAIFADELHSFMPENGYVPDQETAIKIAEAVLLPIYGEESLNKEKPLVAELKFYTIGANPATTAEKWYVYGTMPEEASTGGVCEIEIDKQSGEVLRVSHGK